MENLIQNKAQAFIFDLKGSLNNRYVKASEPYLGVVLKDQNFIELNNHVTIPYIQRNYILNILNDDVAFLKGINIIDYSLILAIYPKTMTLNRENILEGTGEYSYSIGIIDFLQLYTLSKKIELFYKKIRCKKSLSVCSPNRYALRFNEFMRHVFV